VSNYSHFELNAHYFRIVHYLVVGLPYVVTGGVANVRHLNILYYVVHHETPAAGQGYTHTVMHIPSPRRYRQCAQRHYRFIYILKVHCTVIWGCDVKKW